MSRKPLVWKLFPIYFVITLASTVVFGIYASEAVREYYHAQVERDLEIRTRLIRMDIKDRLSLDRREDLQSAVRSLAKEARARITVIAPSGTVVADSRSDPRKMANHASRPEIARALEGGKGTARRISPTLGVTMVYVALPIDRGGRVAAVLRTAVPADAPEVEPWVLYKRIALGVLFITLVAGAASFLAARGVAGPLARMKQAAVRFADGDFRSGVPIPDTEEFASLAETLNRMAAQLDTQVRTITLQSGERQAILASMKEAVVAIDNEDRVLILNPAAEELLGVHLETVKGKTIQEAVRNPDLQRFFGRSRDSASPTDEEIAFYTNGQKLLQATGTALLDAGGARIGVLVVLNDITQTRKLESMRKEFVANVSHELKTPITSIKGFVETLREGAVSDPEKAREFLEIVARQSDRLNAIIEDLLALSAIEQRTEAAEISLTPAPIKGILEAAVVSCRSKAEEGEVAVDVEAPGDLTAPVNAPLLEQAITNLVDNAVKYSPGGRVRVRAAENDGEVVISVEDTGIGIEPEHIPRLFERFYRVDKARSRKLGGTGLGLAIVKHIVQAHHGTIEVQSAPGKGSAFSIHIPDGRSV